MSVQSQIDRIEQNVANTYAVLKGLGADMPSEQNSDNLPETAGTTKAVLYSAQNLTKAQKTQARENIGAVSQADVSEVVTDEINAVFGVNGDDTSDEINAGDIVELSFPQMDGNRVYYGGKNLFDGTIGNLALAPVSGVPQVMTGTNYRGFYCPIKGGETITLSRSKALGVSSERFYYGFTAELPSNGTLLLESFRQPGKTTLKVTYTPPAEAKYLVVYLSNASDDWSGVKFQVEQGSIATSIEPYSGNIVTTDGTSLTVKATDNFTVWSDSGDVTVTKKQETVESIINKAMNNALNAFNVFDSDTGNVSIVCAKEHTYNDGTAPKVEYYLLEECGTNKFYVSNDLKCKKYAFTFDGDSATYAFGITKNNDIIACAIADSLTDGKDDSHRKNPYCWLASEKWSTQHEVDFGTNLKPCGWLSNCGFRNLPNGDALFSEYTRMTVATANVWKLSGSPADANNWTVVKQFEITTENNLSGFKHIHTVQYDHYTGVVYFSTGDDDENAMIFHSTDDGANWTQLGTSSQKYCRNLSFTFTKDYIYWAPDFDIAEKCYLLRATRDDNGVMDFDSIEDYIFIGDYTNKGATYGTAYLEELDAILILDRCDSQREYMPLLIADLKNDAVKLLTTLESPGDAQYVGFRTRYSEWYPKNGRFICGFGFKQVQNFICTNHIKGFGNMGYMNTGAGANNINNLVFNIKRNGDVFNMKMDTLYI